MITVDPGNDFAGWKDKARRLLAANVPPDEILWEDGSLFQDRIPASSESEALKVSPAFIELARTVSCHADASRWATLYSVLWRVTRNGEKHLMKIASDPDIDRLSKMAAGVRRGIHKMHAFVRFKLVGTSDDGTERFAAWFEPDHHIVAAAAPFFRERFANMDWSIFTPKGCVHWIGRKFTLVPGVPADPTGDPDALESAWSTYYRSIFNPARLKIRMMQSEMPKRYWKNLPEAAAIPELIARSRPRTDDMIAAPGRSPRPAPNLPYLTRLDALTRRPEIDAVPEEILPIGELRRLSETCRVCPLWQNATCTVFGEGPSDAKIMIVGEQPGDHEDVAGRPFVGPAGKLLDQALAEAGIDRSKAYLTNAVKHFKWTPRGKHRLHQTPDRSELEACRPWLLAELRAIQPEVILLLGATAIRSLTGEGFSITQQHGLLDAPHLARRVIATYHPAHLLRMPDRLKKENTHREFASDLSLAISSD